MYVLTIILLALVFIHSGYLTREAKEAVALAAVIEHVSDQCSLTGVCRQDADLLRWVAEETHVLVEGDSIFGLAKILDEVRAWFRFAFAFVVGHIDELVIVTEAGVGGHEFGSGRHGREVVEVWVTPFVELGEGLSGAPLLVEEDSRYA